ncbi:hypothetical protein PENTCL1PPCAC_25449, partial [Pristionchus entomophagus]
EMCFSKNSRLIDSKFYDKFDHIIFILITVSHCLAIFACAYLWSLWLAILVYKAVFLLSIFMTLAQAMSGYIENCLSIMVLFILYHMGTALCLFNLHILFIHTHRGTTFYQWIPLKIREFYQILTETKHPKGHLYQKLEGIEFTKEKCSKVPLLEEDQEDFAPRGEQFIEKTCIEG